MTLLIKLRNFLRLHFRKPRYPHGKVLLYSCLTKLEAWVPTLNLRVHSMRILPHTNHM